MFSNKLPKIEKFIKFQKDAFVLIDDKVDSTECHAYFCTDKITNESRWLLIKLDIVTELLKYLQINTKQHFLRVWTFDYKKCSPANTFCYEKDFDDNTSMIPRFSENPRVSEVWISLEELKLELECVQERAN